MGLDMQYLRQFTML